MKALSRVVWTSPALIEQLEARQLLSGSASLSAQPVITGGNTMQSFTVNYTDSAGISSSSIGPSNLTVAGPGGLAMVLSYATVNGTSGGTTTVVYTANAPGGNFVPASIFSGSGNYVPYTSGTGTAVAFTPADNGTYTVSINANSVKDGSGASIPAGSIGTFHVGISDDTIKEARFTHTVIDASPGSLPTSKALIDIYGNGFLEPLVGHHDNTGLYYYMPQSWSNPTGTWVKHTIASSGDYYEDIQVADVNGDGYEDIIASIGTGNGSYSMYWLENPLGYGGDPTQAWKQFLIGTGLGHNFTLGDLEDNGKLDVITQRAIYFQNSPTSWTQIDAPQLNMGDFDGGTSVDVLNNGIVDISGVSDDANHPIVLFENPLNTGGNPRTDTWTEHVMGPGYTAAGNSLAFASGDFTGNGLSDIVTGVSERDNSAAYPPPGGLVLWLAPAQPFSQPWTPVTLDSSYTDVHKIDVADINGDGKLDIVAAEQEQSVNQRISIFYSLGSNGQAWQQQVVANTGSQNIRVGDITDNGLLDLFDANHGFFNAPHPIEAWLQNGASITSTPAPPAQLFATAHNGAGIALDWQDMSEIDNGYQNPLGFVIERSTDDQNFTQIAQVDLGTFGYVDADASSNKTYYYRVAATDASGTSAFSDVASAAIGTSGSAPPTITTEPSSHTASTGADVQFAAAVTGSPTPTVQWFVSTDAGTSFTSIAGATSTTLNLGAASAAESGNEYEAIFTNTLGTATTSPAILTVTQATGANGSLSGTEATAAASYNLTTLGTSDWAHWGRAGNAANFDHDASGGSQISNVTKLGPGSYGGWTYSARTTSWTKGSPTASDSADHGYIWANNAIGAGYSFTVPASTASQTLYVYLGGSSAGGTLTAKLSDSSASPYTVSVSGSSNFQDLVAITYNAATAGQTLTVTYDKTTTIGAASGSVDLIAAWLTGTPTASSPTIITNPQSQSVFSGADVNFTAAATGSPTPAVQWELNTGTGFAPISGATSTTLSIGAVDTSETGYEYEALFTNSAGTVTTAPAILTVTATAAPTISTNPQSQSVTAGTDVTFTSAASGTPTPAVQWEFRTDDSGSFATIAGATSTTFSIDTVTTTENGYEYEALFSNVAGTAATAPAVLTVSPAQSGPVISTNPQSQTVAVGDPVQFTAAATGNPTPTVQWEVSTDTGNTFTPIDDATATTLSLGAATADETGYEYQAIFTNAVSTATTTAATLMVTSPVAPTITTNPQSQSVTAGANVTFTAAATGSPTPTIQWELSTNTGASFSPIAGATFATFAVNSVTVDDNDDEYEALFTNTLGTATTSPAILTVTQATGANGSLSGTEATAAASYNLTTLGTSDWAHWGRAGNAANFDHDASGGSQISNVTKLGPGSYGGWTYSARTTSWTKGSPTASDSADHGYIWANNAIGAGYSFTVPASTASQTLYVYLGGSSAGGTLTAKLSDSSASPYTVSVSGSSNFQDLVAITYNAATAGQTLTVTYDKTTTIGAASGSVDLIAAWLTGTPTASSPTIITNPQSQSVLAGTSVSFNAAASGSPTPAVQWELSTNSGTSFTPLTGQTATTLALGPVTVNSNGYEYEAIFTNTAGTATTSPATLTVAAATGPTITTNPQSRTVTAGTTVTFTAAATGTPSPTVQWELSTNSGASFSPISGATATTLSIGTATVGESGNEYEAIFTNSAGTAATSPATLTVTQATGATGSLSGSAATAAASYNLTTLGTTDWAHWGRSGNASNFDHDKSGGSQISNVTKLGPGSYGAYTYSGRKVSWTNGTPTSTNSGDTGYLWANNAIGAGYSFTVPASTTSHTVYVYLGGASSGGTLTAKLSDSSASPYTVTLSGSGNYQDVVAITYKAASASQTLTLTWAKTQTIGAASGSVDLIAAWMV